MRKKDRPNHNPRLKWTRPRANQQYLPFFWTLAYMVMGVVAFGLSPITHSFLKLFTAETGTQVSAVVVAFSKFSPTI
ncbi:hypothetical protein B0H14DRAFT_3492018 [Mycena olivaceomarginata]|nr:hypothetical protein B0H14DRAFT_3492018 [Mycena olivaceomarginata]